MKNEARFIEKIDKKIRKEKLFRAIFVTAGIIFIAIHFILSATAYKGVELPILIKIIPLALGISLLIVGILLVTAFISEHKSCKKILKEIFEEFPIDEEKVITLSAISNFPEEMNLEGKMIFALGRNTEFKVKLYIPTAEDSIGVRVEPKGSEYFTHTVCVFNVSVLAELKDFLIKN